jgi:TetR/AcrR family transcriptional regulator, repressor for uid operon
VVQRNRFDPPGTPERRRQILAAAEACFARRGFHGATMPEICAEAGLSPGTVYRYFRSKDELIEAMVEMDRAETLEVIAAIASAPDTLAAVGTAIDLAFEAVEEGSGAAVYLEVCAEAARNPRIAAVVRRHEESVTAAMVALLERGQARGEIDPELDPIVAARVLGALIDGLILHKAVAPEVNLDTYAAVAKRLVAAFLAQR